MAIPEGAKTVGSAKKARARSRRADRQNSGFVYYTTRILRNAAMPGPLTPRHKCTVYGDVCLSLCRRDKIT
jgi:hypothetical protein